MLLLCYIPKTMMQPITPTAIFTKTLLSSYRRRPSNTQPFPPPGSGVHFTRVAQQDSSSHTLSTAGCTPSKQAITLLLLRRP